MDDKVVPVVSRMELTGILRRLEAATSRLEDMASATIDPAEASTTTKGIGGPPTPAPTGPLPPPPPPTIQKEVVEELPASIEGFDAFLSGAVKKFVELSKKLGGPQADQVGRCGHIRWICADDKCRQRRCRRLSRPNANTS